MSETATGLHGLGLDAADWRRHRLVRLAVALAAVPVALLLPTPHRLYLVAGLIVVYLPVAVVLARLSSPPRPLGATWWAGVVADCLALFAVLVSESAPEPLVFVGFLLVVVVNAVAFGLRAAVIASGAAIAGVVAGHIAREPRWGLLDLLMDTVGFALAAVLATYLVGRQTEALRRHRERLERALADLRRVDDLRSALVSTLAHDVRGPLTAIGGSLQTVLSGWENLDGDTKQELLEGADRQTERLMRLALGLLDLARMEEGRLELDVRDTPLRGVVERSLSHADLSGQFEVAIEPSLRVAADPERLEQIVVNIATNALRHGAPPLVVRADVADGFVEVAFEDAGPGVPEDRVGSLFEPFRRGGGAGSVGLGLWIVRVLAEAHGGGVAYGRNTPTGARFVVRLPGAGSPGGVVVGATIAAGGRGES